MNTPTQTPGNRLSPSNKEVAKKIGLTHSGVSRIRTGGRLPGVDTMARIEEVYDWTIQGQIAARARGTYSKEFEVAISGGPGGDQ